MNKKDALTLVRQAIYDLVQANTGLLLDRLHEEVDKPSSRSRITTALDDEVSFLYERASRFKDRFDY